MELKMRLVRAKLVEVCQHKELDVSFVPGLTVIVGPNGAGKSNMVNLIRASLTNDFGFMGGKKEDNIRRLKSTGVPSYVESTWHVASGIMTVRRGLSDCRSSLVVNGKEEIGNKESEITKRVLELTNLSAAKINDFLFANQDSLQDVISGTKSRRAELFQSLCGIEVMDKADRVIRDVVAGDRAIVGSFQQTTLDISLDRWRAAKQQIHELKQQVSQASSDLLTPDDFSGYNSLIQDYSNKDLYRTELELIKGRARKTKASLQEAETIAATLGKEVEVLRLELDEARDQASELTNKLQFISQENTAATQYIAAKKKLATPAPERPELVIDDESELRRKIAELEGENKRLDKIFDLIDKEGVTHCDKCGSSIHDIKDHKEEYEQAYQRNQDSLILLKQLLRTSMENLTILREYERKHTDYLRMIRENEDRVASILNLYSGREPQLCIQDDLSQQVVGAGQIVQQLVNKLQSAENSLSTSRQSVAIYKERLAVATKEYNEISKKLENTRDVTRAQCDEAKLLIGKHLEADNKVKELSAQLKVLRASALRHVLDARRLRAERRKLSRISRWVDCAENARSVLSKNRLPAKLIAAMMGRTTSIVNDYLEQLGVTYRVQAELQDFAFQAVHPDGTTEPAARLSVGQKTCLAIAFWLARAEVFVGALPFFCLDEPTAHLDDCRIAHVADLFGILSAKLASEGRQGIVITHHAELSRVATHTIQLSNNG